VQTFRKSRKVLYRSDRSYYQVPMFVNAFYDRNDDECIYELSDQFYWRILQNVDPYFKRQTGLCEFTLAGV
jgi:hypothetical protein